MLKGRVAQLKEQYPVGSRVRLTKMEDIQAPPVGTRGTIIGVDDIGSLLIEWENGSSLNVVDLVDEVKFIE